MAPVLARADPYLVYNPIILKKGKIMFSNRKKKRSFGI